MERNYSSLLELYVCAATLWTTAQGGLPVIGNCLFIFFVLVFDCLGFKHFSAFADVF